MLNPNAFACESNRMNENETNGWYLVPTVTCDCDGTVDRNEIPNASLQEQRSCCINTINSSLHSCNSEQCGRRKLKRRIWKERTRTGVAWRLIVTTDSDIPTPQHGATLPGRRSMVPDGTRRPTRQFPLGTIYNYIHLCSALGPTVEITISLFYLHGPDGRI